MATVQPNTDYNNRATNLVVPGATVKNEFSQQPLAPEASEDYGRKTSAATPMPYNPTSAVSPRSGRRKAYNFTDSPTQYSTGQAARADSRATGFNRVFSFVDEKQDANKATITNAPNTEYTNDRRTNVKLMLVNKVLQRPFFTTPYVFVRTLGIPEDAFTFSTFTQVLQIFIQIAIICICSQSMKDDDREIEHSVWAFLIAQASIILAISTFFTFRVLHLGQNGTIFYSLLCSALTFSAFGVSLRYLMPARCTNTVVYCRLRKATTGLVSLSTFVWLIELVIFATIAYVAKLDILPDPSTNDLGPFVPPTVVAADNRNFSSGTGYPPSGAANPQYAPPSPIPSQIPELPQQVKIKKFIVSENGIDEVFDDSKLVGKAKAEIYAAPDTSSDPSPLKDTYN